MVVDCGVAGTQGARDYGLSVEEGEYVDKWERREEGLDIPKLKASILKSLQILFFLLYPIFFYLPTTYLHYAPSPLLILLII